MDFQDAFRISQQLEKVYAPELVVVGFRRQELRDVHSWAIDIANPSTAQMITLDERDDMQRRIERIRTPSDQKPASKGRKRAGADAHGTPETSSTEELVQDQEALGRWNDEGGNPDDPQGALEKIEDELQRREG